MTTQVSIKKLKEIHTALHPGAKLERRQKKVAEEKNTKMDPIQIKMWRRLLLQYSFDGIDGWALFCRDFLTGKIHRIWQDTEKFFALNFISTRAGEVSPHLDRFPNWENAVDLMERYGLASFDAMIVNMFLCSRIQLLLTADLEMADCVSKESKGFKLVFVPDSALR